MGGISSNGNTSAGTIGNALSQPGALSSLFMGNQPTQSGQQSTLPTIAAPQSQIGQMDFSQLPSSQSKPSQPTPVQASPSPYPFEADPRNPGYGWMQVQRPVAYGPGDTGSGGGFTSVYVQSPTPQAAPTPYQPSTASQMAALINAQYGKK